MATNLARGVHLERLVVFVQVLCLAARAGLLLLNAVQGTVPGSQLLLLAPNDGLLAFGLFLCHAQVILQARRHAR